MSQSKPVVAYKQTISTKTKLIVSTEFIKWLISKPSYCASNGYILKASRNAVYCTDKNFTLTNHFNELRIVENENFVNGKAVSDAIIRNWPKITVALKEAGNDFIKETSKYYSDMTVIGNSVPFAVAFSQVKNIKTIIYTSEPFLDWLIKSPFVSSTGYKLGCTDGRTSFSNKELILSNFSFNESLVPIEEKLTVSPGFKTFVQEDWSEITKALDEAVVMYKKSIEPKNDFEGFIVM